MCKVICYFLICFSFTYCSQKHIAFVQQDSKLFNKDPVISMRRTACYGTCPQYEISIYDNGLIKYDGKAFVDKLDCFQAMLHESVMIAIKSKIKSVNFFSLDNEYVSPITDIPSIIVEVNLGQGIHKVTDRLNGPKELKTLHSFIDSIHDSITTWETCNNLE